MTAITRSSSKYFCHCTTSYWYFWWTNIDSNIGISKYI